MALALNSEPETDEQYASSARSPDLDLQQLKALKNSLIGNPLAKHGLTVDEESTIQRSELITATRASF